MRPDPHAHCGYCGAAFAPLAAPLARGPRLCGRCGASTYRNPIPVAVLLLPVADGLLVVRRAIAPGLGEWALPGGFLEVGEEWRVGAARELVEETGIVIAPHALDVFELHSTEDSRLLLIFCAPREPPLPCLPDFAANHEVHEIGVMNAPRPLAFPLHTAVSARYLADRLVRRT